MLSTPLLLALPSRGEVTLQQVPQVLRKQRGSQKEEEPGVQSFRGVRGLTLPHSYMPVVCLAFAEKRSCRDAWVTTLLMLLYNIDLGR